MSDFILAYHGGSKPKTPQEGAAGMAKWKAWLGNLGDAVVNPGTPMGPSKIVGPDGVTDGSGPNALTGYTIVRAQDMDAALEIARACPFLDMESATLEVAQLMDMKPAG